MVIGYEQIRAVQSMSTEIQCSLAINGHNAVIHLLQRLVGTILVPPAAPVDMHVQCVCQCGNQEYDRMTLSQLHTV